MARAAKVREVSGGGSAARVAARRRDAWKGGRERDTPARGAVRKSARGRSAHGGGGLKKAARLVLLVVAMLAIGFFTVLVVDVATTLVGRVHLGDVTVTELWHKVVDRVLDRDVPRVAEPSEPPAHTPPHHTAPSTSSAASRAPVPAARPEEDARHVAREARPDPQVERAREHLDELLGRL